MSFRSEEIGRRIERAAIVQEVYSGKQFNPYYYSEKPRDISDSEIIDLRNTLETSKLSRPLSPNEIHLCLKQISKENEDKVLSKIKADVEEDAARGKRKRYSPFAFEKELNSLMDRLVNGPRGVVPNEFGTFKKGQFEKFHWKTEFRKAVEVKWGQKGNMPNFQSKYIVLGTYNPDTRNILIAQEKPNSKDIVTTLANFGVKPNPIQTLEHEWLHAVQYMFGISPFETSPELIEAQAHRAINNPNILFSKIEDLPHLFKNGYSFDERKAGYAIWAVERMNALGMSQAEIALSTTDAGKWNEKFGLWEDLEERLQNALRKVGLDEVEADRIVMLDKLERSIGRESARITSANSLHRIFRDEVRDFRMQRKNFWKPKSA